jgi:hypothetical protein
MGTLPLRAALRHGGLLVGANWPVVLVDFAVESLYKLALGVPVLGGALVVGTLLGTDLRAAVADGLGPTADLVLGSLTSVPVALLAFLLALAVAGVGGVALMFIVKAGTLAVVVDADRSAGDLYEHPLSSEILRETSRFGLAAVVGGARRFARRAVALAVGLGGVYVGVGATYVAIVTYGLSASPPWPWAPAWPVLVLLATSIGLVVITGANLAYDLLRVIVVTDDCSIRVAVSHLRRFVIEDARQVLGIFSAVGGVQLVAGALSLLAAAGLTPIAYLPFVGLIIVPLQAALWVVRGLVFEGLFLVSLSAYQTQYRRFAEARRAS